MINTYSSQLSILFAVLTALGYYLAYLHAHRRHKFSWASFIFIIIWPLLHVISLIILFGSRVIVLFVVSCVVGMILEFTLGWIYFLLEGKKLWKYSQYNFHQYISWLCIPVWGIAGVAFWSLGKTLGL